MRHLLIIGAMWLAVILAYSPTFRSNYCGFDDMYELQRLEFQDPGTLSADLATVLAHSYKYRPLSFTVDRITYRLGHGEAWVFRLRNFGSHLLSMVAIYFAGLWLFRLPVVAATAALLFGLDPLANQPVMVADWVYTFPQMGVAASLLCLGMSLRASRGKVLWLVGSLVIAAFSVLMYEPTIVVFGSIYLTLGVYVFLKGVRSIEKKYWAVVIGFTLMFGIGWMILRHRYLPSGSMHPFPLSTVLGSLMIYAIGPMQVIDPVLANTVFDTPLPTEMMRGDITPEGLLIAAGPAVLLLLFLLCLSHRLRYNMKRNDWVIIFALVLAWAGSLVPYLFFTDHQSETYCYGGIMFLSLVVSRILWALFIRKDGSFQWKPYAAVVLTVAVLYSCGTWVKSRRLRECGDAVTNIFTQLPGDKLRSGEWRLVLANVPGEPATRSYGTYGYRGIDTLGIGEYGRPAVALGLQYAFRNPHIQAEVVNPDQLQSQCSRDPGVLCYWVHWDGRISDAGTGSVKAGP
jgi:hypothetical protein